MILRWADWWTRQEILNAVVAKFTTQDHIDVRHVLDRNAIHRCSRRQRVAPLEDSR